jgi:AcrR family transcriptional regulator
VPETRQRRGRAVLDAVLDATVAAMAEHGYGFSVDGVARTAGVHKTTVYRRWETKPQLVSAAVERLAAREIAVTDTGDAAADLTALAVQVAAALGSSTGGRVLRAAVAAASEDPALVDVIATFLAGRYAHAVALVDAGRRAGQLRADVDGALLWRAMVNPLHVAAICGTPADEATARRLAALVLDGARPIPAPAPPRPA